MSSLNIELLARMIREKRGSRGLRVVAKEIGASAPTLSRIESQKVPDVDTFIKLCDWLGVPTDTFIVGKKPSQHQEIIAHLRADRELDQTIIESLANLIELAYKAK